MFDIGFIEMLVVGLILLLVVGPERLPEVARTVGGWVYQAKQYVDGMKEELDRETGFSEIQRETRGSFEELDRETRRQTDMSGEGQPESGAESGAGGEEEAPAAEEEAPPAAETDHGTESAAASDMERELEEPDRDGEDEPRRD